MADNFSYDVFLSHNEKDKPRVRKIAERLKQSGLRVWLDEWNIKLGEIIALKVDEGLDQSRVLVLCISPNALGSGWVGLERSTAIHRDPSNEKRRFIPLLLADCKLPDTLRRYKYLDFRKETESAFDELLRACRPETTATPPATKSAARRKAAKKESRKPADQTAPMVVLEHTLSAKEWSWSVAVSPDGQWAASAGNEAKVRIWDLKTGQPRLTIETGQSDFIRSIAIAKDGKKIFTAVQRGEHDVRIWNPETAEKIGQFTVPTPDLMAVVPQDSDKVITGSWDKSGLRIWNIETGELVKEIETGFELWGVDVSNGKYAVAGGTEGRIGCWELATGESKWTAKSHSATVHSVKITPDGKFALTSSADFTIKVWSVEDGTCVGTLEGHKNTVQSIDISPDGSLVASTGWLDGTVRLWDWKSGTCLQVITVRTGDYPTAIAFQPDNQGFVVGTHEGAVFVYRFTGVRPAPTTERRYVNAKIVLLGEGTVGKTSLAHRLIEDKYVIRDRTHGMNVWRLDLPLPSDATWEREALLWDLAGQEDYRLIHQLFLDETALALLLINPQKADPFAEAGDWLKALKSSGNQLEPFREPARLLIFSQVDVGGMKLSNAKIDRFCEQYGFAHWLPTSAKTGENCSDSSNKGKPSKLKSLIGESIAWDKLPWTSTPRLLTELKNAVVNMRDEKDIRLLRFAELTQRLEQALPDEKFAESDVRTAVKLLSNHGLARPLKFGDLVLLEPELLNGYAGAIIRAARVNKDEIGSVLEAEIYGPGFDFTGVERLKYRSDEELLLRALVQTFLDHSLCIAEDTPEGRQLVFPSQYRREKDIPRDPDIFVSYTFTGEWQTVWTTLVVRLWYSQEFGHKELWRNAAEFMSPKGFTLGLKISNKQGEGIATISLYFDKEVPDDLKAIFIEFVHRHLAKYGCEVSRDRRYLCQECGKPVKDLDAVRKRLEAKKDFITCQECDARVPLIDFIEQRLKSDPVARKIIAMDEIATRELDTQALEQILIGHMMAICGEANQIFRPTPMFDYGIDGEVEFKDNDGQASGKRIYIQLKSGNSYLRLRKSDGSEVFDVKNERHLEHWISQPVDVYLVVRQTNGTTGSQVIRWMNVTRYLKERPDKTSRQIVFSGEKLDMEAVWKVRDEFFPPKDQRRT